jgi:hypothetical protein
MSGKQPLLVIGLMLLSALVSSAALGGAEPTLQEALDLAGFGINVDTDELFDTEFLVAGDHADLEVVAQYAALSGVTGIRWQAQEPIIMGSTLMRPQPGGIVGERVRFSVPSSRAFELVLTVEDYHWWHSIPELNADGLKHARVFPMVLDDGTQVQDAFVFAWEDRWGLGDRDYQDMVFAVNGICTVPEPGALTLFGALAGAAAMAHRRRR